MKRKLFLVILGVVILALALSACSSKGNSNTDGANQQAEAKKTDYPKRPIEMVIPFGAGGASDIFARQYAQIVEDYIGQPINCINKGGAGTIEGMTYAYGAAADGYTILEITPSLLIVEAQEKSSIKFRSEFEPIMRVMVDVVAFGVSKDSPFQTFDELLAYAKENPGKLKIGGISPGGLDEYIANGFAKEAGIEWTYVPYTSGSEVKAAVLGGELDVYQDKLISFLSLVESGDIRPLIVLSENRLEKVPLLKDVPSAVEKGINFTQGSWRGFCIKKGVPEDVKQIIIDAFEKAYQDPRYKEMEEKSMIVTSGYLNAEDFRESWDEEYNGYVEILKN